MSASVGAIMPGLEELEHRLSFLCLPLINGQCTDLSSSVLFKDEVLIFIGLVLPAAVLSKHEGHLHGGQLCCSEEIIFVEGTCLRGCTKVDTQCFLGPSALVE